MVVVITTSKLRGGQVTPSMGSCTGTGVPSNFIMQTFGVEVVQTDFVDATSQLLRSSDFQGQKPGDHDDPAFQAVAYASASYNSLGLTTTDGDLVYSGNLVHISSYNDDEDSL